MTTKVDNSLFDQAPVEDPPPAAALSALGPTLSVLPEPQGHCRKGTCLWRGLCPLQLIQMHL